ncbi:MAG: LacI family DNA-binding transcriptional regulator, partial [Actinobacteria bacterium]|nr:LacI family DNA-binding transcriptional regulator [Actinomycetota bacterium]
RVAVTVRDVARHAQVSSGTVSRVLNGQDGVDEALRARVLSSVQELGYVHVPARRSAPVSEIGFLLIVRDVEESRSQVARFWAETLFGAEQAARRTGTRIVFRALHRLDDAPESALEQVADLRLRGALLVGPATARTVAALREAGVSLVLVDNAIAGSQVAAVLSDNFYGTIQLVDHLVALGHRDIAFIGGPAEPDRPGTNAIHSIWWRALGFRTALQEHGLTVRPELIEGCDLTPAGGAAATRRLLHVGGFTAVVAANDPTAVGVMQALASAGITVPEQMSVVGFDDDPAVHTEPALTTAHVDTRAMAELAVQLAIDALAGAPPVTCTVPVSLVIRNSTGPLRPRR